MRITGLALVLALLTQAACLAETPETARPDVGPLGRGRLFNGQNWWTRFGEPVNAAALSADTGAKGDIAPVAMYGHDYIYGPGSCDCPPPCINQLWDGYYQHPKRCDPYVPLFGGHCGACGDCGNCGHGHGGCGLFGHGKGCGKGCGCGDSISCTTKAACGCSEPIGCTASVPDCGCAKPACGCKHAHLGHKWKGFLAHWNSGCDSCSAPLGCGCAMPIASPVQIPSEKQALSRPLPIPDDAALIALPRLN